MFKMCILAIALMASQVMAEPPPPVPEEGLVHYKNEACVDPVWGLKGTCYYSHDIRNVYYIAFFDERDICMYIMQYQGGGYVEIWRRSADT